MAGFGRRAPQITPEQMRAFARTGALSYPTLEAPTPSLADNAGAYGRGMTKAAYAAMDDVASGAKGAVDYAKKRGAPGVASDALRAVQDVGARTGKVMGAGLKYSAEHPGEFAKTFGQTAVDMVAAPVRQAWETGKANGQAFGTQDPSAYAPALASLGALAMAVTPPGRSKAATLAEEGVDAVKGAGKTARRTLMGAPDLRTMSTEDAIRTAAGEPHLIAKADGGFVGGPKSVQTLDDLAGMRAGFDSKVAAGAPGADWYDRARGGNIELAGADPARQRLLSQEEALWSAQANPDTNLNFTLQGHNAYEGGAPAELVRTGQQARTYRTARDAGKDIPLGEKTGVYAQHLDPTQPPATTGTNDIWHGRVMGYDDQPGGWNSQQHRFMDYETMLAVQRANQAGLGGRTNWTAGEIQAAPWVAEKGASLAARSGGRKSLDEGLNEATKTYPDYFDKYTAFATHEDQPYANSGHLPGSVDWTPEQRQAYANDPRSGWKNNQGRDTIYDALGLYQRPVERATGVYTPQGGVPENNPVHVARPMVGISEGDLDPASRSLLDKGEATRAYFDVQGAGAWHKPIFNAPDKDTGSLFVPHEGPLTVEQLGQLSQAGGAHGIGDVVDTGQGATMTDFYNGRDGQGAALGKAMRNQGLDVGIDAVLPGAQPRRAKVASGYLDYEPEWQATPGSGAATDKLFERLADPATPAAQGKLDTPELRAQVRGLYDRDAELAAKGEPVRDDVQNARDIFSREGDAGGWSGLQAARAAGAPLPSIALPIVGLGAAALGFGRRPQGQRKQASAAPAA